MGALLYIKILLSFSQIYPLENGAVKEFAAVVNVDLLVTLRDTYASTVVVKPQGAKGGSISSMP